MLEVISQVIETFTKTFCKVKTFSENSHAEPMSLVPNASYITSERNSCSGVLKRVYYQLRFPTCKFFREVPCLLSMLL